MGIRNQWISEPDTPERLAETMARTLFAVVVYMVVLLGVVVGVGVTIDWFAALGCSFRCSGSWNGCTREIRVALEDIGYDLREAGNEETKYAIVLPAESEQESQEAL